MQAAAAADPNAITRAMKAFIESQGEKKIAEILEHAKMEFKHGKEKLEEEEKVRLVEKFEKDLTIAEINTKIERSAALNKVRI